MTQCLTHLLLLPTPSLEIPTLEVKDSPAAGASVREPDEIIRHSLNEHGFSERKTDHLL